MVVEEAMRLYPPIWVLPRQAVHADEIGGFDIPAGSTVAVLLLWERKVGRVALEHSRDEYLHMATATTNPTKLSSKRARTLKWSTPRWSRARDLRKLAPIVFGTGPIVRIVGVSIIVGVAICLHFMKTGRSSRQRHEALSEVDDFSRQPPGGRNA
jgi:hypothetical protein